MSEACGTAQQEQNDKKGGAEPKGINVGRQAAQQHSQLTSDTGRDELDELIDTVGQIPLGDEFQCQLKALQCPFTWKLKEMSVRQLKDQLITRLQEEKEEMDGEEGLLLLLRQFGLQITLCYEKWCEGDIAAAREHQSLCEKLIESSEEVRGVDGLKHISKSCSAYLYCLTGNVTETCGILNSITNFEKLDAINKACVIGMRGIVMMEYGYEGTKQAISHIEQALEFDPSCAEWYFFLGKSLRRIRRIHSFVEIPDKKELNAFEKAVELSDSAEYCMFLAQSYRETAFRVYSLHRSNLYPLRDSLNAMNEKSAEYYRKALEMAPDSSHINIRSAEGFLKLPYPHRDVELAKKYIDKALQLAPNSAVCHHVAGRYYEQTGNIEAAKHSYESAGQYGTYGAYMDLIRLEFKTDEKYNPLPMLNKMLSTFVEESFKIETLAQIGAYYYLKENDLKNAVTYWLRIIEEVDEITRFRTFKPICVYIKVPIDLLQVALDESRLALSKENVPVPEAALYKRLISMYEGTELVSDAPKAHRQNILDEADRILKEQAERSLVSNERGRGGRRGCGNYQEQRGGRGRGTNGRGFSSTLGYQGNGCGSFSYRQKDDCL